MPISKPADLSGDEPASPPVSEINQLFTANVAHDFNNLLSIIALNLNIMRVLQEKGRTDDLSRYVTAASTATQQAAALIHRLQDQKKA